MASYSRKQNPYSRVTQVSPVRTGRGTLLLLLAFFSLFAIGIVYLSVLRVHYGHSIQNLKGEVSAIHGEVRDLQSRKAGLTSITSIEKQAERLGMVYPDRAPKVLAVKLPLRPLDGTGIEKGDPREMIESGNVALASFIPDRGSE